MESYSGIGRSRLNTYSDATITHEGLGGHSSTSLTYQFGAATRDIKYRHIGRSPRDIAFLCEHRKQSVLTYDMSHDIKFTADVWFFLCDQGEI